MSDIVQQLEDEAAAAVMATPQTRRFLRCLIFDDYDYLGQTTGHPSGLNPDQRAGQRAAAIDLIVRLRRVDASAFALLVAEHEAEMAASDIASRRATIAVGNGHTEDG